LDKLRSFSPKFGLQDDELLGGWSSGKSEPSDKKAPGEPGGFFIFGWIERD
jgi:hypothetical protein